MSEKILITVKSIILILLIPLIMMMTTCSDVEDDPINFKVISSYANFTGYYIIDGGHTIGFSGLGVGNNNYEFAAEVVVENIIEFSAMINEGIAANIQIKVYNDGVLLQESSKLEVETSTTARTLTFTYEVAKEEETDTTEEARGSETR